MAAPDLARQVDVETQRSSTGRGIAAAVCVVIAILLTTPAGIAYWGQRTLTDSARYLDTVGPLVNSPEVQDAVATKVIATLQEQVDVEDVLNDVFAGVIDDAPRLQQLVGPLSGAINGLIEREVRAFVASDAFEDLWVRANTRAQQALLRLLEGDETGAISLQDDQVVLDVSEVIEQVQQRLVDRGLTIAASAPIPDVDKQIVLVDAPALKQARTIYAFANPLAEWLIVIVALLYLAAFLLSRRRPRMAVIIGVGLVANALIVGLCLSIGRQVFINELAGTVFGPASSVFYDTLLTYLERGWKVLLGIGLVLIVAGWFSGRTASGAAVRSSVSGTLETVGSSMADGPLDGVGRWVSANVGWLRVVAGAIGVLVLMWGNQASPTRLLWAVVVTVVILVVLQVLVGVARAVPTTDARSDVDGDEIPELQPTGSRVQDDPEN